MSFIGGNNGTGSISLLCLLRSDTCALRFAFTTSSSCYFRQRYRNPQIRTTYPAYVAKSAYVSLIMTETAESHTQ
jgi:hypothetical protein